MWKQRDNTIGGSSCGPKNRPGLAAVALLQVQESCKDFSSCNVAHFHPVQVSRRFQMIIIMVRSQMCVISQISEESRSTDLNTNEVERTGTKPIYQ